MVPKLQNETIEQPLESLSLALEALEGLITEAEQIISSLKQLFEKIEQRQLHDEQNRESGIAARPKPRAGYPVQ